MKGIIFKYLSKNYSVIKYNNSSYWPPKYGHLLFDNYKQIDVSWSSPIQDIKIIFSVNISDSKYYISTWYEAEIYNLTHSTNKTI